MAASLKFFCKTTSLVHKVTPTLATQQSPQASRCEHGCPLETLQRAVLRNEDGKASTPLGAALDFIAADRGEDARTT
jgi:hypothetical protein